MSCFLVLVALFSLNQHVDCMRLKHGSKNNVTATGSCKSWCQSDRDAGKNRGRHCAPGDMAHLCGGCSFCRGTCNSWCQSDRNAGKNRGRHCAPGDMAHLCGGCSFCADSDTSRPTPSPTPGSGSACLCVFDIDRTLTSKQSATSCPGNKVLHGIWDAGYGGGTATLSQLTSAGIASTFCGECYLGICSAGDGSGASSTWNKYILDNIMRSPPQDQFQAANPHAKRWSYGTNVQSPYVLGQGNKVKQHSVEGIRQWYGRHGISIAPGDVYFYGDRTENMKPFARYGINAKEISCASRDRKLYGGRGMVGYCGATASEIQRQKGQLLCR